MPVSVVVGGQFGSEGNGKVALELARRGRDVMMVRVGAPNSGHTVVAPDGRLFRLRHLPSGAVLPGVVCVLGAGTYIDPGVLRQESECLGLGADRLLIDPKATVVTEAYKRQEAASLLRRRIGSTQTGTGAAVQARVIRD